MDTKMGSQWHCTNRDCGWSMVMLELTNGEGAAPRCICGNPMQSAGEPRGFQYLEFLRVEEPLQNVELAEQE